MLAAASTSSAANVTLGAPFQDHAVLQRDAPITVWGTAASGASVTVTVAGQTATARADAAGRWAARLPALPAGGPHLLEASAGPDATRSIADVLVGDVFLCSGQSNMEMSVGQSRGGELASLRSANDRIRLFTVAHLGRPEPGLAFETPPSWQAADPTRVRSFSAACFFMGREIHEAQHVPVGLIHASWGGTAIEPWIGSSALTAGADAEALEQLRLFARDEEAANQAFGRTWASWWRQHGDGEPWTTADAGPWTDVPSLRNWKTWGVPELASLDGMIWFRRTFELTAAQAAQPATLALGGIDIGEPGELHPGNKREVGRRLARAARHAVYGEAMPPSGPAAVWARRDASGIVVSFAGVTERLATYSADVAIGFELCGTSAGSCRFVAGSVEGSRVVLPIAAGAEATRVRFCWGPSPIGNLSDATGLPAGPFELTVDAPSSARAGR
jgi:hypothetical protein